MKMFWDTIYKGNNRIWGEEPSELAVFAVYYLKTLELDAKNLSILDIGCGYGRDAIYFSKHLRGTVLGIDSSKEAIDMAKTACSKPSNIDFRCCDFTETGNSKYDLVFIS
jgi:ubiquinone/menaquinone biosynthesis C-methylase UbiE